MSAPLNHHAELMRLIVQRLAEEMRVREQVRVASFRKERGLAGDRPAP